MPTITYTWLFLPNKMAIFNSREIPETNQQIKQNKNKQRYQGL